MRMLLLALLLSVISACQFIANFDRDKISSDAGSDADDTSDASNDAGDDASDAEDASNDSSVNPDSDSDASIPPPDAN